MARPAPRKLTTATGGRRRGLRRGAGPSKWWLLGVAVLVLLPLAVLVLWLMASLRRPHLHARGGEGAVDELRQALARLGYDYPARTTLAELERRLKLTAGPGAARYVELLSEPALRPARARPAPPARAIAARSGAR